MQNRTVGRAIFFPVKPEGKSCINLCHSRHCIVTGKGIVYFIFAAKTSTTFPFIFSRASRLSRIVEDGRHRTVNNSIGASPLRNGQSRLSGLAVRHFYRSVQKAGIKKLHYWYI